MAGVLSAAMLSTSVSVWGAEFTDGVEAGEIAVAAEVSEDTAAEEAPVLEDENFTAEAAEATEIPISKSSSYFPDKAFRKYITDEFDTNKNGKLSTAEIQAATTFNLKGLGIANLKGIERFPYATSLYAMDNKLKSVNLTKNTKLKNIILRGNDLTGTLDLRYNRSMVVVDYSDNALTKVSMPSSKYLKKIEMINASKNKFTTQTNAGLYYKYINADIMPNLTEIYASDNAITGFNCNGTKAMILDLRNNKITKFEGGTGGFQAVGIYLDGKYNTLKSTSKVDFSTLGNAVPQRFSCNSSVRSKVVMVTPRLSVTPDWNQIKVTVGASSGEASYKLERKAGSGAYKTVATWDAGELDDPEFGENQVIESDITPGATYTYKLTTTVMVQNADKVPTAWSKAIEKTVVAAPAAPTMTLKSSKKGYATISWKAVPGATGYQVYYGSSASSAKSAVTKNTTKLYVSKSKLKSARTYYFRVRAIKKVGDKTYYGPFCTAKGVKIK